MADRPTSVTDRGWRSARRRDMYFVTVALLVVLIRPALSIPDQEPAWPAAVGLAAFVVLYLVFMASVLGLLPGRTGGAGGRLEWAALGLLTALGVVLSVVYGGGPGWGLVMVFVAAAGTCILPAPRVAIAWLAGTVAAEGVIVAVTSSRAGVSFPAQEWFLLALSIVLVGALTLSGRRTHELIGHLHHTQAALAETAVEAERLRFSRDLHDLLGHTLSLIVVKAEVAKRSVAPDPEKAACEAREIEQIGRRALTEVREAVTGYRQRPFATELDAARTALADAGLRVTVRTASTPLPAMVDSLFGWVVREAATNALRHSGAGHCEIEVRVERAGEVGGGTATLEVRDDGVGGEPAGTGGAAGRGLPGLAERLAEAGGELVAGGAPAGGWRLAATVPVGEPP